MSKRIIWATQMDNPQADMIPVEVDEAPRKIYAVADNSDWTLGYGEWRNEDMAISEETYYHADVVQELREKLGALERLCSGVAAKAGPQHAWWDDIFDARALLKDS